ncbi:hypothetical protein WJX82_006550 [Trebouxia sp. C0006]
MEQIAGNTLTGNAISGGVGSIGIDFATGLSVSGNIIQDSMDGVPGLKTQNNLGPMFGLSISATQSDKIALAQMGCGRINRQRSDALCPTLHFFNFAEQRRQCQCGITSRHVSTTPAQTFVVRRLHRQTHLHMIRIARGTANAPRKP